MEERSQFHLPLSAHRPAVLDLSGPASQSLPAGTSKEIATRRVEKMHAGRIAAGLSFSGNSHSGMIRLDADATGSI
jgi:hypothetical protein